MKGFLKFTGFVLAGVAILTIISVIVDAMFRNIKVYYSPDDDCGE